MKWRIYYADGAVLDGEGDPANIPNGKRFEVQIIVQEDKDHGRSLTHFADYYLWREDLDQWIGVAGEISALMALTQNTMNITCVLWGSMMDPYSWADVQRRAREDPGLPPWSGGERKRDRVRQ